MSTNVNDTVKVDRAHKINAEHTIGDLRYGLSTVFISGAGYIDYPFRGISPDSALGWEEAVWGGELNRAQDFSLSNINNVTFGLVARVELTFNYENVGDYKILQQIAHERVCYVTYYNRDKGEWVERQEMAFTGNELDKLYAFGYDDIGRMGVKIKLVATNRDRAYAEYTITLHKQVSTGSTTYNTKWLDTIDLSKEKTGGIYTTTKWSTVSIGTDGKSYLPDALLTVTTCMTLYERNN